MKDDTISRAAALDALGEEPPVWYDGEDEIAERNQWRRDVAAIKALPSVQPVVISKLENTTECEDAVSREAVLDEIHRYMEERDYTIGLLNDNVCGLPPVTSKQPGWIPCDVRTPKHVEESYWICTDTGYQCQCRWTNNVFGLGARDEWGWKLLDIPQYSKVVAWQPLPTPYREGGQDGD